MLDFDSLSYPNRLTYSNTPGISRKIIYTVSFGHRKAGKSGTSVVLNFSLAERRNISMRVKLFLKVAIIIQPAMSCAATEMCTSSCALDECR